MQALALPGTDVEQTTSAVLGQLEQLHARTIGCATTHSDTDDGNANEDGA